MLRRWLVRCWCLSHALKLVTSHEVITTTTQLQLQLQLQLFVFYTFTWSNCFTRPPASFRPKNIATSPHNPPHQAMLVLQEDGTLAAINEPYFDSSRCAYLEAYEEASSASQNLTLVDMGGVFLVLGIFVSVSTLLWVFRRFPSAKTGRKWFFGVRDRQKAKKVKCSTCSGLPLLRCRSTQYPT